ncbi:superoxide dismutase [Candidatus Similichlamydia epinepheli]|uniref:superoxide dismutase n=1 Tax=Candidatus Similichlamydia epinepheli TaxID=1903953 RepID=UPI000D358A0B|nr:superoxide dismutase [Candidatus Similichlamydia epinepheli]
MKLSFTLPKLGYEYDELEPWISSEIMELHHQKHHAGYLDNFLKNIKFLKETPDNLTLWMESSSALSFHGGGHFNHSLFWESLLPVHKGGGELKIGPLQEAISDSFGSLDRLVGLMGDEAISLQGSGWVWLGLNQEKKLFITTTINQIPLYNRATPLLGIDLWEHAYYLQYKNAKMKYFEAIWNVINWKEIEKRFLEGRESE